jgi:RsiW-degrading membrane proteinase PrsW (M82 family)
MGTLVLVILALAPPVGFLLYILRFDRNEPEPVGLVAGLCLAGALSGFPAALLEGVLQGIPPSAGDGLLGALLQSFLVISPVEEAVKLATVMVFAWRSRHFSEQNDGIVYAGAVSIGFAAAENLFYVLEHGIGVGVARALTSIPGHAFAGVLMGHFLGKARFPASPGCAFRNMALAFLVPWALHGAYDTFVLSGTEAAVLVLPVMALYFFFGIRSLRQGRERSAAGLGPDRLPLPAPVRETRPGGFRRVAGRTILVLSGLFWAFILAGLLHESTAVGEETAHVLLGGVILSALPVALGVLLEVSGRRAGRVGREMGS